MIPFQLLHKRGQPLLYLPLNRRAAERGLELYPAQTTKALFLKGLAKAALRSGMRVGAVGSEPPIPICPQLDELLRELSGTSKPYLAILAGNPKVHGRRFICMVMDADYEPQAVLKIGASKEARELVRREAHILKAIPPTPGVPGYRGMREFDSCSALILDYVPGQTPSRIRPAKIFEFLRGWVSAEEPLPLFEFPKIIELQKCCDHRLLKSEALRNYRVRPVLSNGDFAAWNIRENRHGSWTVLDWERGEVRSVPCWSWFHFFFQNQILVRKSAPSRIAEKAQSFLELPHLRSYCDISGVAGLERELMLLYLLHIVHVLQPAEGLEQYREILGILERKWLAAAGSGQGASPSLGSVTDVGMVPEISVVTPSYNQLEWLKLCAASIADQAGVRVEHIVQDAGTPAIESLTAEGSIRAQELRVYQEKDNGMYDAINRGFLKARGEIVAWLNCDEQYLPGALRVVVEYFREHPEVDILFGDALLVDEKGAVLSYRRTSRPTILHTQLSHLGALSCAMFLRRTLIERGFLLDAKWKTIADATFVTELLRAKCKVGVLRRPLAAFAFTRVNLGQSSLLFAEMERWRGELPAWVRALAPLVVALHRFRKLCSGAYKKRSVHTALVAAGVPPRRMEVHAESVPFGWPLIEPLPPDAKPQASPAFSAKSMSYEAEFQSGSSMLNRSRRVCCAVMGVIFIALIYLLDLNLDVLAVTPFFCALSMLALSFVLIPAELGVMATVLATFVILSLQATAQFRQGEPRIEWLRIGLRLGSFATASALAILFSRFRLHAARMTDQTFEVLRRIPVPVVVSDADGKIRFANAAAMEKCSDKNLVGLNFMDLFLAGSDEGSAHRIYRRIFEDSVQLNQAVELSALNGAKMNAHTASIGGRENRLLVTLVKGAD